MKAECTDTESPGSSRIPELISFVQMLGFTEGVPLFAWIACARLQSISMVFVDMILTGKMIIVVDERALLLFIYIQTDRQSKFGFFWDA